MTLPLRRATTRSAALAVALLAVTGCSGSPTDPLGLSGCLDGDRGTIAVGVSNTSGAALTVDDITLSESSGVEIIDRFIAIDDEARSTPVLFSSEGRDGVGGVDLDQAAIDPGASAFVGVEIERTGSADGRVGGLLITVDGDTRPAPVTLDLRDACS